MYRALRSGLLVAARTASSSRALSARAQMELPVLPRFPPSTPPPPCPRANVRVGLCQMAVGADKDANIAAMRAAVRKAADGGAQLVVLPEIWNGPYSNDAFPTYAEPREGPSFTALADGAYNCVQLLSCKQTQAHSRTCFHKKYAAARESRVVLVGGSIPEREGSLVTPKLSADALRCAAIQETEFSTRVSCFQKRGNVLGHTESVFALPSLAHLSAMTHSVVQAASV